MKQKEVKVRHIIGFVSTLDDWYQDGATVEQLTSTKVILRMRHSITKLELTNRLCDYLQRNGLPYSSLRIDETGDGVFRISTTGDLKTLSKIRLDKCEDTRGARKCSDRRLMILIEKYCPSVLANIRDRHRCFQTNTHYFVETDSGNYSFRKIYNNGTKEN